MRKMCKEPNANKNTEKDVKQGKDQGTDVEKEAWVFVDLVFTGKYSTPEQIKNLEDLIGKLKNSDIALEYLYNYIQKIITIAEAEDDEDLKETFKKCYKSLNERLIIPDDKLPFFRMVKDIDIKFYYKIVFIFKSTYENRISTQSFNRINKLLNENKKVLCSNIEKTKKDKKETDKKINKTKADILDVIKEKIYPEIITILGIFTAITFAIFGGMNLLSSLFQNMKSTHASLGQAIILAAIFGLIMWGIAILLFYWITTIKENQPKEFYKNWGFWLNILFIVSIILLLIMGLCFFFK